MRALAMASLVLLAGSHAAAQTVEDPGRVGMPEDWTHRHLAFSGTAPASPEIAQAVRSDARFWHQQWKRTVHSTAPRHTRSIRRKHRVDWSVSLGATTSRLAAGAFPAKYTFDINASPSCTNDFVVFALDIAGSAGQATLVAYNNLYTEPGGTGFCAGTGPTVKWAYNTGGAINTSPVLSLNGRKVAWVANANPPVLHVLTIGTTGNNGSSVTAPAPGFGGLTNNATDTTFTFPVGSLGDTRSSLFVDYSNDAAYVATDDGKLHKITGVFNGTPAEAGGWPVLGADGSGHILTSPVYDSVSGNIFYGDDIGTFGYIRDTASTRGVCLSGSPPCLGLFTYSLSGGLHPIIDAPLLDPVAENVFVFVGDDSTGHARVLQTDVQLSSSAPHTLLGINGGNLYAGAFDNNYYTNPSSGFLYACGYAGGAATPTLYQVGFDASNVMNTSASASSLALSTAATQCSPMTEIFNPPTLKDWLFVGVANGCPAGLGVGTAGCVEGFDITGAIASIAAPGVPGASRASNVVTITTTAAHNFVVGKQVSIAGVTDASFDGSFVIASVPTATTFTYAQTAVNASSGNGTATEFPAKASAAAAETGGSGGIVVDNVSTNAQASSIYFSTQGDQLCGDGVSTGGCAVKLTQSGLK